MPQFSYLHFAIVIPALHSRPSDRNQIWHTYSDRYGTDSNLNKFEPPDPRGDFRGSTIKKSGKCNELPEGGPNGDFRGSTIQKSEKCHGLPRKSIFFFNPHPTQWFGVLGLKISKSLGNFMNCRENGFILNP